MNKEMTAKKLTIMAMFLALGIALNQPYIQVGENLQIYFYFIVNMLFASIFSLGDTLIYAVLEDIISFFLFQSMYPFFPGYTVTAMVSCAIYWLFLHKEVNLKNIIISKAIVNLAVNVLLGSLWSSMLYSKGYMYYMVKSLIKNVMMLPIEVIIFYYIYKLIKPLINKYIKEKGIV